MSNFRVFNKLAEVHWMHDVQEIKHIQHLVKHNAQIFNLKMNKVNNGIHYYFTLRFTQQFALKDNYIVNAAVLTEHRAFLQHRVH